MKNYIFSIITINDDVTDQMVNDLDKEWSWIITRLGESNFTIYIASHVKNGKEFRTLYPTNEEFFNVFEFHKIPSWQHTKPAVNTWIIYF